MSILTQELMLLMSMLMLFCVISSKLLSRFGVPILIFFIAVGMFLGADGLVGIYFDNPQITKEIGNIALAFILFFGGMDFRWKSGRPIVGQGILLSTVGVVLTAGLVGLTAYWVTDMNLVESLLLGAVVSSTDAPSVFSTLRAQKISLKGNLAPLLEFESGCNDPVAYLLTVTMIIFATGQDISPFGIGLMLVREVVLALLVGVAVGLAGVRLLNRIRLNIDGLYPIIGLSIILFTYSFTMMIHGNYFLAIYVAGLIVGNSSFVHKMRFIRFFDGQSWIMQIILFVTLGLQVFPSQLKGIVGAGIVISLALIFVIRPLVVMPLLALCRVPWREQLFISLVGFRGAASIVFATYAMIANIGVSNMIFNLVFFTALFSISIQGSILKPLAEKLGLVDQTDTEFEMKKFNDYAEEIDDMQVLGVYVTHESPAIGYRIDELIMPRGIRILAVRQVDNYSVAQPYNRLAAGNRLLITCENEEILVDYCREMKFES